MKIIIMNCDVSGHDAIGNEIEIMYDLLQKEYDCCVYAAHHDRAGIRFISKEEVNEFLSAEDNLIIYHHSIYWEEGEELLIKCQGKLVFRYHNITNPEFFQPYSHVFVDSCKKGREQTERLIKQHPTAVWLPDSLFNAEDLKAVPQAKLRVQPPFHIVESWNGMQPDEVVRTRLQQEKQLKLLSVGRIVPNKKYEFLIEAVRCYCENYDSNIHLRLVGIPHPYLVNYQNMLRQRIVQYRLEEQIELTGEATGEELLSYYLGSDIYVCASEHEGFCVPLIESQYLKLPVIGRNFGAVGETLGEEYIPMTEIKEFAAAIRVLSENPNMRQELIRLGTENYNSRFAIAKLKEQFLDIISWVLHN